MSRSSKWITALIGLAALVVACGRTVPAPVPPGPGRALRLVSTRWPPFTDDDGKTRVALEVARIALDRAEVGAKTTIVADGELTASLRDGTFDGSAALWKTPEREAFLVFSEPYLQNRLVLVGAAGNPVSATSLTELAGRRVGIVAGYGYGEALDVEGPSFVEHADATSNFRAVLDGEVDYILADELLAHHVFEHHRDEVAGQLVVGEEPLITRGLHVALRREVPGAAELIEAFNRQLARMLTDGTYHHALGVRWIHADTNGDGSSELIPAGPEVGEAPPERSYEIVAPPGPRAPLEVRRGYLIDGHYYQSWERVPDTYKVTPTQNDVRLRIFEW